MAKSVPVVDVVTLDFHDLARLSDDSIYARFQYCLRLSKRPLLKKSIVWNASQIMRSPQRVWVRLLKAAPGKDPVEVAQFGFVPPPNFGSRPLQT